ncbi:nucleotidyltransferase family protein [archaeon]|nr:nucleotidyltransferase family protein [Nanoarchaeota archaeon]MBU4300999.1 nucleotidyltransferase family protein [Nanoarchaeota archaeon]MBU4452450.1 nucleotidyltransferase family protein [Nanoarchaeota archaeon]MCG2723980.1 nucleotidyltransferase family protein [archaeon]
MSQTALARPQSAELRAIRQKIRKLGAEMRKDYKAEVIGIFGSYARGEQKKGSDLDVLVRFYKGATLFDFVGLADFLEKKLKIKVDVVSEGGVRKELKKQIFNEAQEI